MGDYGLEPTGGHNEADSPPEFYISSNSRDVMRRLSDIMRKQGYIGLADGTGKTHYIFDGSKNLYETATEIKQILHNLEVEVPTPYENLLTEKRRARAEQAARETLDSLPMKMSLKGYLYLMKIMQYMLMGDSKVLIPDKTMYSEICSEYRTNRTLIDRAIHYALQKSGFKGTNAENIAKLQIDARERFTRLEEDEEREDVERDEEDVERNEDAANRE